MEYSVSPFEHYMLAEDQPAYAMTVGIRFWFKGRFRRPELEAALRDALPLHPLFLSRLVGSPDGPTSSLVWRRQAEVALPWISWEDESVPVAAPPQGMRLDPAQEVLRLFFREGADRTMLLVQFHHAVCDGVGLFSFFEDWLRFYDIRCGADRPAPTRDPALLERRAFFGLSRAERFARRGKDVRQLGRFLKMLPLALGRPRRPLVPLDPAPDLTAVVREELPPAGLAALRAAARGADVTLNDVLLRDLFLGLADWERLCRRSGFGRRLALAVPVCMREGGLDAALPSTNFVSMVVVDRAWWSLLAPGRLLGGLAREMQRVKRDRLGHTLVWTMALLGVSGRLMRFFLGLHCQSTAVLTNLGVPFAKSDLAGPTGRLSAGGVELTALETLPPLRPKTRVAVSVNSYGGTLRFTMRYDTTWYSAEIAQRLLRCYVDRVRSTAKVPAGVQPQSVSVAVSH